MRFRYDPIKNNIYSRHGSKISYIVIHDTGNTNKGANAKNHKNYMNTNTRGASAHYFVDDKEVVQFVGDSLSAGAVGDGKGRYGITNSNSLSIEMCINSDGDFSKTYKNTVELTKNLMKKFNIPLDRVVRHYDASRKNCPSSWNHNNWAKWYEFKKDIAKPIEWVIDLSKDSEFGNNKGAVKMTETNNNVSDWAKKDWEEGTKLGITDGTRPKDNCTREEVVSMIVRALKKK